MLSAGAWSLPVIAVATASPSAAASPGDPMFVTSDPLPVEGSSTLLAFPLSISGLPAVPAAEEGDLIGVTIELCLPEGLRVVAVSSPWSFAAPDDSFDGGGVFVFNATDLPANWSGLITITIEEGPGYTGLNGELGALALIAGTGFMTEISWDYAYPGVPAAPLPNCSAGRGAPR